MSQNSFLEMLSVTNNALKALEKTSSSKSSGSEGGTPRSGVTWKDDAENHPPVYSQEVIDNSRSSGVGKTVTQSNPSRSVKETLPALHDSDDSTTASEVLIHSTLVEKNPTDHTAGLNSSASSQGSRCRELDNFNVADARKVKVSKKQLREIVSPQDSVNISTSNQHETNLNFNNNQTSYYKPENGKIISGSFPGKALHDAKVRPRNAGKDTDKSRMFTEHKKSLSGFSQGIDGGGVAYTVERHDRNTKVQPSDKPDTAVTEKPKSASQQFAHFPYKVSRQGSGTKEQVLVEQEEHTDDWDAQSVSSSQPEIVTVEERIVNISSQALVLSDYEDSASQGSAVDVVSAANRPQSFPNPRSKYKPQGAGLKQGALMQGSAVPKSRKGEEVQISKFSLTEKQRELREALSKRGTQSKPVKRVVQPKMVHSSAAEDHLNKNNNMDTGEGGGGGGGGGPSHVESITAAVAASAAVAATQPFLKMQQEMESKMQSLLGEMERVQKQVQGQGGEGGSQQGPSPRLEQLEQQLTELTERRLQHLETLQSQQMQLQAHLLSMSQGMSQQRQTSSHHPTYFPTSISHTTAPSKPPYNRALIERELMRGRLQGEDKRQDYEPWRAEPVKSSETMESALDTPNPRSKPPRPSQFNGAKGGLLQEILAAEPSPQLNTTFNLPPGDMPSARTYRSRRADGASPVEKARKLVHDLSNLEDQTAESIWSEAPAKGKSKRVAAAEEEPAPIEYYLKRVRDANTTPYSKLGKGHSRSSSPHKPGPSSTKSSSSFSVQAPVQDKFGDVRHVLNSVMTEREILERNLELMLRSRQDVDVYALMGGTGADRSEMTRIQKMVEKRINSLKDEVKREVEWDLQHNIAPTKSASVQDLSRKAVRGVGSKTTVGFGSGAPRMSRIDSGLHKSRSVPDTVSHAGKGKKIIKARPAPKKSKIPYEDEEVMTQIYGKAQYQKGRTTVKDPYLHFQNQAKQRASRLPSPKRADGVVNVKSSKIQTEGSSGSVSTGVSAGPRQGGAPRQYYFSPTRGYVPITSTASAPVAGQLIPMAVPLGKPRMDPGLALAPDDRGQSVSVPPSGSSVRPVVTAATNVAVVAINADPDDQPQERRPELGKQVLPAVDIDSLSPSSSPRSSDIQIRDPDVSRTNAGYMETFHYHQGSEEEDEEGDRTLTEEASDEEQHGTGISLPGYHQPTPARDPATSTPHIPDRASQTSRPPDGASQLREQGEVPWEERCDELAEDLRRRDVLQNKAKYWLEQELMARMLMKMYPVMAARAAEEPEQQDDVADRSESIPDDESLLVGDTIGQRGLQLFVDAGQPVNNNLVNALVREVIAEKVGGMLGRRQDKDSTDARATRTKSQPRAGAGTSAVDGMMSEESAFVRPSRPADRVPTPQPTPPPTSPIPGFISQHAPATPPLTPPPPPIPPRERSPVKDISSESSAHAAALVSAATSMTPQVEVAPQVTYESETEISESLDLSEELRALDTKLKDVQAIPASGLSRHDIHTPTPTPPPTPPPPSTQPQHITTTTTTPPPSPPIRPITPLAPVEVVKEEQTAAVGRERERKSPQPWGNPDSPGPELNPNYEEPSELAHTQPRPLMMSVAVGTEVVTEPRRSPSPQRRQRVEDPSELDSLSSPSSATDTLNENLSEGQWLVSRSEGQVAGLPLDNDIHRLAVEAVRKVDTSTASTLRDTEDLDLDDTDVSRSEGEFLHKGDILNPETDPILALLMQMQHQPGGFRQYDLPANRVQHVLSSTNRSEGEVTRNGMAGVRRSVSEMSEGQVFNGGGRVTVVASRQASPPTQDRDRRSRSRGHGERRSSDRARSASPAIQQQAPTAPRSRTPPASRNRQQQYQPVSSGLPPSLSRRPLKSVLVRTSEDSRHSRDSEPDSDRRGPPTEYGTRTLTPDQLNTEALIQSGTYLTRSMGSSGRQGSTKKSVEFDLSGTYEMTRRNSYRSDDGFTSMAGSSDRLTGTGRSLGLRYSFEDTESERDMHSTGLRMSVTIPSTEGASESDVSEIDMSDNTGH